MDYLYIKFLCVLFAILLVLALAIPALAAPIEKDVAAGEEDSYLYGKNQDEILMSTDTTTGGGKR